MRLTQAILDEYIAIDCKAKELDRRKEEIRQAIIEDGRRQFKLGNVCVLIRPTKRDVPRPRDEIESIIGDKLCNKIMKTIKYSKVILRRIKS